MIKKFTNAENWIVFVILFLFIFDGFVWLEIFSRQPNKNTEIYFLDVGQGDSELVVLPGNVKILIDGGPNDRVVEGLFSALRPTDRYIDLVVLSHAETDHFTGLIDVLKRFRVGAFVYNGRSGTAKSWPELAKTIEQNNVPVEILMAGDKISYLSNNFDILAPDKNFIGSSDLNDTAMVELLKSQNAKILFTGDIGSKLENYLTQRYDLDVDVLKVAHHGSKYSSSEEFLNIASPKLAVIEVGKNSYGHPTADVLSRLASVGSQIFRTDKDGMIKLVLNGSGMDVFKNK